MEEDIQAAGRVRLFQFQQRANQKRPQELERPKEQAVEEILVISGTQEFGGLGSSLAFANMTIHGRWARQCWSKIVEIQVKTTLNNSFWP